MIRNKVQYISLYSGLRHGHAMVKRRKIAAPQGAEAKNLLSTLCMPNGRTPLGFGQVVPQHSAGEAASDAIEAVSG